MAVPAAYSRRWRPDRYALAALLGALVLLALTTAACGAAVSDPGTTLWSGGVLACGNGGGRISVARIDIPTPGTLTQIQVTDPDGSGAIVVPVFAVTVMHN